MLKKNWGTNKHIFIAIGCSILLTLGLYSIHLHFFSETFFFGRGLIAPITAGLILGLLIGIFYTKLVNRNNYLTSAVERQEILKEISLFSHHQTSLKDILDKTLRLIITRPFAKEQSRVGIFLKSNENWLHLKSHINLPEKILENCGSSYGLEMGDCLCGMAAQQKRTIFKNCVDHDHSTKYETMEDHGHYNVPIISGGGELLGVIVIYLDVNHLKQKFEILFLEAVASILAVIISNYNAELELKKQVERLEEVQNFAGIGTWALDNASGEIKASEEVFNIMGFMGKNFTYTEAEFLETIHPEDLSIMKSALEEAKKGVAFELETRHFRNDGTIAYIINKCKPKILENSHVPILKGIIIDVTRLRTHEIKLKEKQTLLNGVLRATPDPLYLIDLESNNLVYTNSAMENIFAQKPQLAANFKEFGINLIYKSIHPDDIHVLEKLRTSLQTSDDIITFKLRTNMFSDEYQWIEQKILVYNRNKDGSIHQLLGVAKNITPMVSAQNKVTKLHKELLAQYEDIKKVNNELDQFVYSVSHDLRAPLTSMIGLVHLSKIDPNPDMVLEYMSKIGLSVKKLDGFIKDILDYSRNARTGVGISQIDFHTLVKSLIQEITITSNPDIKISCKINDEVPFWGDVKRIRMIFNNIISNAIKYADPVKEESFLKINISTSNKECVIRMKDNGIGISKENLPKVFNMFYRGDIHSQGSGLGLYIVKETIHKLNGSITIESSLGQNTQINLVLPNTQPSNSN